MGQTLIASKFFVKEALIDSLAVPPELFADSVLNILWKGLFNSSLTYDGYKVTINKKGVFAKMVLHKKAEVLSDGVAQQVNHKEGFVFVGKIGQRCLPMQKLLFFYEPFSQSMYILAAENFKVKPLIGRFGTKKVYRTYRFNVAGEPTERIYQIGRKSIKLIDVRR